MMTPGQIMAAILLALVIGFGAPGMTTSRHFTLKPGASVTP